MGTNQQMKTQPMNHQSPSKKDAINRRNPFTCLGVVPLRAGRSRILPALLAVVNLLPAGRVTAQTFTTLHTFTGGNDGALPWTGLITNSSGNTLYGTARGGGDAGNGTLFAVNTDGSGFTNLHSFAATSTNSSGAHTNGDGTIPNDRLLLSGNTFYGTAQQGGGSGAGTVF